MTWNLERTCFIANDNNFLYTIFDQSRLFFLDHFYYGKMNEEDAVSVPFQIQMNRVYNTLFRNEQHNVGKEHANRSDLERETKKIYCFIYNKIRDEQSKWFQQKIKRNRKDAHTRKHNFIYTHNLYGNECQ